MQSLMQKARIGASERQVCQPAKKIYWDRRAHPTYEDAVNALKGSCAVYVGNLSFFVTALQVRALFSSCGVVKNVIMGLNRVTKKSCGFCFVEYFKHEDAASAVALLNGARFDEVDEIERKMKVELDPGFSEGRQYGRGKTGGQVADHFRKNFDPGRGGWGASDASVGQGSFSSMEPRRRRPI